MSAAPLIQSMPITGRVGLCAICHDAPATFRVDALTESVAVYTFTCAWCNAAGCRKALAMHAEVVARSAA